VYRHGSPQWGTQLTSGRPLARLQNTGDIPSEVAGTNTHTTNGSHSRVQSFAFPMSVHLVPPTCHHHGLSTALVGASNLTSQVSSYLSEIMKSPWSCVLGDPFHPPRRSTFRRKDPLRPACLSTSDSGRCWRWPRTSSRIEGPPLTLAARQ